MTVQELLDDVRARGGELRAVGMSIQYRPAKALTTAHLRWLAANRPEVIAALTVPDPDDRDGFRLWLKRRFGVDHVPVGRAGPDSTAWAPALTRRRS